MTELLRLGIRNNMNELCTITEISLRLLDICVENGILTEDKAEEVVQEKTKYERARVFYNHLKIQSPDAFAKTIEILKRRDVKQSDHVIDILTNVVTTTTATSTTRTRLQPKLKFGVRGPVDPFCGRIDELSKINVCLATATFPCVLISGLGGIGKSELSRKYCEDYQHEYDAVICFVCNPEDKPILGKSFLRLAEDYLKISTLNSNGKRKQISSIVEEVYENLKVNGMSKCLIIFDNAEEEDSDEQVDNNAEEEDSDEQVDKHVCDFMPKSAAGFHFIVTSRNQKLRGLKKSVLIDLQHLELSESIPFITTSSGIVDTNYDSDVQIECFCNTLQGLPLSLQQAVAYIKYQQESASQFGLPRFSIMDYLNHFNSHENSIPHFPVEQDLDAKYLKSVSVTWNLTLEMMRKEKFGKGHGPAAVVLLGLLSYSAPEVPFSARLLLERSSSWLDQSFSEQNLREIIQIPHKYSMYRLQEGKIYIHRLVQCVIRGQHGQEQSGPAYIERLLRIFSKDYESRDIPHVAAAWRYFSPVNPRREYNLVGTHLGLKLLEELKIKMPGNVGNEILLGVLKVAWLTNSTSPSTFLLVPISVSETLLQKFNHDEALTHLRLFYDLCHQQLGEFNEFSLMGLSAIAYTLQRQGKWDDALEVLWKLETHQTLSLEKSDVSVLDTVSRTANILVNQRRFKEATELYKRIAAAVAGNLENKAEAEAKTKFRRRQNQNRKISEESEESEDCRFFFEESNRNLTRLFEPEHRVITVKLCLSLVSETFGDGLENGIPADIRSKWQTGIQNSKNVYKLLSEVLRSSLIMLLRSGMPNQAREVHDKNLAIFETVFGSFSAEYLTCRTGWDEITFSKIAIELD